MTSLVRPTIQAKGVERRNCGTGVAVQATDDFEIVCQSDTPGGVKQWELGGKGLRKRHSATSCPVPADARRFRSRLLARPGQPNVARFRRPTFLLARLSE